MITSVIKIKDILPATLDTRESASFLIKLLREDDLKSFVLDFTDVIFMSRSFADQFHKELYNNETDWHIDIKNADVEIIAMLNAVSRTQTSRKTIHQNIKTLSFNNFEKLEEYTFAW